MAALRAYLDSGEAVAFLGAGASAPLYPLWGALVGELVEEALARGLSDRAAETCRRRAATDPDAVVELVQRALTRPLYREALRRVFRARRDPDSGRSWTPTHELVVRCPFKGIVTTNYDPGILDARMAARPGVSATGFASWTSEDALDRWRRGDVFGDHELPVLFAHGHHNEPDALVLATSQYRQAYAGKLAGVLGRLFDADHVVWVGFSFADARIGAVLREVAEASGSRADPGSDPRHVALLALDPDADDDPAVVRDLAELQWGCRVVLYPAPGGDHAALAPLLESLTDLRFPTVGGRPSIAPPPTPARTEAVVAVRWVHGGQPVDRFCGRQGELAKLDRWAADPEVRLIGVSAWGGAGKTALVTQWLTAHGGARQPRGGLFAWSFYEEPSADRWAEALLSWGEETLGVRAGSGRTAERLVALARAVPLILFLDGLEVAQEGPVGADFGRLLDGVLRDALNGLCRSGGRSLAVLTSRFPFADLERFDGTSARMLEVPSFTPAEGADLLAGAGAEWLNTAERRDLSRAVDGHALALDAVARMAATQLTTADRDALRAELAAAVTTDERVAKVLAFYARRLSAADQALVGIVSLFGRPVAPETVLALGAHDKLGSPLATWTEAELAAAVATRLGGLVSRHAEGALSAHPLVRDTFRPLVLSPDAADLAAELSLADMPGGQVRSREEALRLVELIELLLDAGQWQPADELYRSRTDGGWVFLWLPAARLGQRAASAFVGGPSRAEACRRELSQGRLSDYLNWAGLFALTSGRVADAQRFLEEHNRIDRLAPNRQNLAIGLLNLSRSWLYRGQPSAAVATASEAHDLAAKPQDRMMMRGARAYLGAAHDLAGAVAEAERCFTDADRVAHAGGFDGSRHFSVRGAWWADFLLRSGRPEAARRLSEANRAICARKGWNNDVARCGWVLGRCDLLGGDPSAAGARLDAAAVVFRDGEMVVDLAATLADVAEQRRQVSRLNDAEEACDEAIGLAGPRDLVPSHARALAARSRVRADRFAATGDLRDLERARDDADAALRLSTRARQLPWAELEAVEAHACLDRLADADHGWEARASGLRANLRPPGLDPDPAATVEAEVQAQRTAP